MPEGGVAGVTQPNADWIKQNLDKEPFMLALRQQNIQNLIADRRALRDLQRDQGSFGGESYNVGKVSETKEGVVNRVAKESFTPTQVTETPSGKTKVGEIIEGVGNVFAKKEGGTAVGNALRGIFKPNSPAPLKKNYFNK